MYVHSFLFVRFCSNLSVDICQILSGLYTILEIRRIEVMTQHCVKNSYDIECRNILPFEFEGCRFDYDCQIKIKVFFQAMRCYSFT